MAGLVPASRQGEHSACLREMPAPGAGMTSQLARKTEGLLAEGLLACPARQSSLYVPAPRALRLAVQDAALSRRKHGFDSRRARQ